MGRKAWLFVITATILTIALFMAKVTGTEWITGIGAMYGLFIIGNGVEHIAER